MEFKTANHIEHYQQDGELQDYFHSDPFVEQEIRRRYQQCIHLLDLKSGDRVLEIGSGSGAGFSEITKKSCIYFPVDISFHNLKSIREKAAPRSIYAVSADGYHLPYQSSSFDGILILEVLEHTDNPQKILKEASRVLKPGRSCVVSVPYREKLSFQICIHCNRPTPTNSHLHTFDEHNLPALFTEAGFIVTRVDKCLNKIPNRLHWNILTKRWPFSFWHPADRFFNRIFNKPISLIVQARKGISSHDHG